MTACALVVGAACVAGGQGRAAGADGNMLHAVQDRGFLRCGVHRSGVGLAEVNADGYWSGYFVEFCRIVAAATVGDAQAVHFVEVDDISAALALTEDLADVVMSTPDPGEATSSGQDDGIAHLTPILEDRLILVLARGDIRDIADLPRGARICTGSHAAYQHSLERALGARIADVEVISYESIDGLFNAFFRQRCAISHHSFAIGSQAVLRAPGQGRPDLSGIDLGRVAFRPSVLARDTAWAAIVDGIIRIALFDPVSGDDRADRVLSAGPIQRIRAIAAVPGAVFERTLGHDGGQGFEPALPAHGI